MTTPYQPFLISEFKTGLFNYLEPWIRSNDAFEPCENAFIYRGSLQKRNGYVLFGTLSTNPVMGIKTWVNETSGDITLIGLDTKYAYEYIPGTGKFTPIMTVSEQIGIGDGGAAYTLHTGFSVANSPPGTPILPGTFTLTDGTENFISDVVTPVGNLTGSAGGTGTIIWATGQIDVTFAAPPAAGTPFYIAYTLNGPYFTGNYTNFFNSTNWLNKLYLVNNKDPITLFDGTNLSRPPFAVTQAFQTSYVNNVGTCLDVDVYKNRLLIQKPLLINNGTGNGLYAQSIRYSAINVPINIVADVTGNGGELSAPTDDAIQSSEFLRDQLLVFFKNSTWTFRYTGSAFDPFRFDKINNTKSTNAPYGTISYDERTTAMGSKGLIACDGVNVQRYDVSIIDQFEQINQKYFAQCFGIRFDTINQSWMLFPSIDTTGTTSDSVLVYNFLENTWSTYDMALSCLGLYQIDTGRTWASFTTTSWEDADFTWDTYVNSDLEPVLLGGDVNGNIFQMDSGVADVSPTAIIAEVIDLGDGTDTYSGIIEYPPLNKYTFTATDGVETFTDNGSGVLTGDAGGSGTINYATGAWTLIFNVAVALGTSITASYTALFLNPIKASITSTKWNPFVGIGQKVQFGHIDFYYQKNDNSVLQLTFYTDNSTAVAAQRTLTLDGKTNSDYNMKRIYINCIGEFLRMTIDQDQTSGFKIIGMVLWARPAGRLTP